MKNEIDWSCGYCLQIGVERMWILVEMITNSVFAKHIFTFMMNSFKNYLSIGQVNMEASITIGADNRVIDDSITRSIHRHF